MKLGEVKVKVVSEASAANLETSITTFLQSGKERTYVSIQLDVSGGSFVALITYTE